MNFVIFASFLQSSQTLSFCLYLTLQLLKCQLVRFRAAFRVLLLHKCSAHCVASQ